MAVAGHQQPKLSDALRSPLLGLLLLLARVSSEQDLVVAVVVMVMVVRPKPEVLVVVVVVGPDRGDKACVVLGQAVERS